MIPLIDCSSIAGGAFEDVGDKNFEKVASDIGAAMTETGMCNLINHGIDMKKIAKVYEASKTFFNLPVETKSKYKKVDVRKSFNGYVGPGDELVNAKQKNSTELRESWDTWSVDGHDAKNFPNDDAPDFKLAVNAIRSELENMAKKILRCIEIYLQLDDGSLLSAHENLQDYSIESHTILRSLYYFNLDPNESIPPDAIRCGEHSDWGTITLLIQDMVGGLEVKTLDGKWLDATPVENAILLNSGQLLEYWTGGRFHAAMHRVRINNQEMGKVPRQSFVHIVNADRGTQVFPFPMTPVLMDKVEQFEKFNNQPADAYDYFQRLIEASYY
ncbi:1-aminocyclopropane-1-carboxylate oxidase-like [Bradysia coprophila]|uniref:1-aminocyclopropane-1-carboxylate oxidase-like n=1 Tax=Bradysia coprophila TaxID=38358 RepID=UPI00187DA154|nr:1-aminocyclopropane-1-carboxylate oxidase-like [Bradysia coprophila]